MVHSRRSFLKSTAVTATCAGLPVAVSAAERVQDYAVTPEEITALFDELPGDLGFQIFAPPQGRSAGFLAQRNAGQRLFAASAIKTFILCEVLRQLDSADIVAALEQRNMALDASVWSLGSPIFNPPELSGVVAARTVLEAMICRSDNTATDMGFQLAGTDNVRRLIADLGLEKTSVPESTRAFSGYLFGATDYTHMTWEELLALLDEGGEMAHPFLNDVQTLASSAGDFVSYYSRALQGEFFEHPETLREFRRILTLCDYISLIPLPAGASIYAKSGNADSGGFHARSIAGGMFTSGKWLYFSFIHNWYAEELQDGETVSQLFSAIEQSLSKVMQSLTGAPGNRPPVLQLRR